MDFEVEPDTDSGVNPYQVGLGKAGGKEGEREGGRKGQSIRTMEGGTEGGGGKELRAGMARVFHVAIPSQTPHILRTHSK